MAKSARFIGWLAAAFVGYLAIGWLSMQLVFAPQNIAVVWPLSGFFLSALILAKPTQRKFLVPLLFLADFCVEIYGGSNFVLSAIYAACLSAEAMFSWWVLNKLFGEQFRFSTLRQTISFLVLVVMLSNALATSGAMLGANLILDDPFWDGWLSWWSSSAVGNLLMTPLILSWAQFSNKKKEPGFNRAILEITGMSIAVFASVYLAFTVVDFEFTGLENPLSEALYVLSFPVLIWAAIRHGIKGSAVASFSLAASVFALSINATHVDGITVLELSNILKTQVFVAVICSTSLILAVVITEKGQSDKLKISALEETAEANKTKRLLQHHRSLFSCKQVSC